MEILKRLGSGRLIAFDQDEDARANVPSDSRLTFLDQNFRFLRNNLLFNGIKSVDGIIADLGVSFHQFDETDRGFTFRHNAPLDMRMNRNSAKTAAVLLASLEEQELADIFYFYGELTMARKIAREVVRHRKEKPISTAGDLIAVVSGFTPVKQENKFYAKLFQSLRIAVNHEIDYLKEMLAQALEVLFPGGRLVVITYHSLEDRLVKNFMKTGNFEGKETKDFYGNPETPFRLVTKKSITPGSDEISANSRSRSARLRIAEKV